MARFEHLEFGKEPPSRGPASAPTKVDNDERRWAAEADRARRQGLYENALRLYSRALEIDKTLVSAWVGQVQMLIQLEEAPEAELWARKALEIFPGNGELLAARAQALCRNGDRKQAGACSDGALAAQGCSAYRWMVRGDWMLACRQKLAEHCFAQAAQLDRDWLVATESAQIYLHYRFPSRAISRARAATEQAPEQPYAWYIRGLAEQQAGMVGPATQSYRNCLQLCPGHADAEVQLAALSRGAWSAFRWLRTKFLGR